jgi:hypothetical protein
MDFFVLANQRNPSRLRLRGFNVTLAARQEMPAGVRRAIAANIFGDGFQ